DRAVWKNRQALEERARRKEVATLPPATVALLADALARAEAVTTAVTVLRQAQQRPPGDFWLNHELAYYLQQLESPRPAEAEAFLRAALALRPDSPGVHYNLGNALYRQGKLADAEVAYRKALALQEDYSYAHNSLGAVLSQ